MSPDLAHLDRTSPETLVEQIATHFEAAILQGQYRPGDRLPTIRRLAEDAGVSRAAVQEAYRRLGAGGLVSAVVGRGTTVCPLAQGARRSSLGPFAEASLRHVRGAPQVPKLPGDRDLVANLADLPPASDLFPVDDLRSALDRVLRERGRELLGYGDPVGLAELRTLLLHRWDPLETDDVLITTGAQQGIDLVLRTFTSPGDAVAVAIPTYQQLFGLLVAHGLNLVPVASGPEGPDLDDLDRALSRRSVRLLYLMPTFHNPTGRTMDLEHRRALMQLVNLSDVPVLEDEYEKELRFRGKSLPSLRSMDSRGLTVSVHTFSKGLFPGLRMGWVQACREVLAPMAAVKRFMDLETSPLMQAALCEFIGSGCLDRHIRDLRVELGERHRVAQEALAAHMPEGCTWSLPDGGFALWADLPEKGQGERLAELAANRGVLVTPGCVFDPLGRPSTGIRVSLSRCGAKTIRTGIRVLGQCAHEVLRTDPPSQTRLFL